MWGQLESFVTGPASLEGGSQPLRVNICFLSRGWITPAADNPGVQQQLVLSDSLWRTAFGGDPSIVGREMR